MRRSWWPLILITVIVLVAAFVVYSRDPGVNHFPPAEDHGQEANQRDESRQRTGADRQQEPQRTMVRDGRPVVRIVTKEMGSGRLLDGVEVFSLPKSALASRHAAKGMSRLGITSPAGSLEVPRDLLQGGMIACAAPDHASATAFVDPSVEALDIVMSPLLRLTVALRTPAGDPVAGATVQASQTMVQGEFRESPGPGLDCQSAIFQSESGDDGVAHLRLPAGVYGIWIEHERFAWIPDSTDWSGFPVSSDQKVELWLREPWGVVFDTRALDILSEELFLGACPEPIEYAGSHLGTALARLEEQYASCIKGVLFPPLHVCMSGSWDRKARLRVLVRNKGWLEAEAEFLPCGAIKSASPVDRAPISKVAWGALTVGVRGDPVAVGAALKCEMTLRPYGKSRGMWRIKAHAGDHLTVPIGEYAVAFEGEPYLNYLASRLESIKVKEGAESEWILTLDRPLVKCSLLLRRGDERFFFQGSTRLKRDRCVIAVDQSAGCRAELLLEPGRYEAVGSVPGQQPLRTWLDVDESGSGSEFVLSIGR